MRKIVVRVKPGSRIQQVKRVDDTLYVVLVKEPPIEGRANRAVSVALAEYFDVPRSKVRLVSGHTRRTKVFEIAP